MLCAIHAAAHHAPTRVELVKGACFIVLNAERPQSIDNIVALAENLVNGHQHKQRNSLVHVHS